MGSTRLRSSSIQCLGVLLLTVTATARAQEPAAAPQATPAAEAAPAAAVTPAMEAAPVTEAMPASAGAPAGAEAASASATAAAPATAVPPAAATVTAAAPRDLSLTVSPLHLAMPLFEVTGEYRVLPKLGVAAIAGAGSIEDDFDRAYTVWEIGAQAAYYPVGSFRHGMQLGAEIIYMGIADAEDEVDVSGAGLAVGPFVGYKLITDIGFTLFVQAGVQALVAQAEASNGVSSSTSEDQSWLALININAGWSF